MRLPPAAIGDAEQVESRLVAERGQMHRALGRRGTERCRDTQLDRAARLTRCLSGSGRHPFALISAAGSPTAEHAEEPNSAAGARLPKARESDRRLISTARAGLSPHPRSRRRPHALEATALEGDRGVDVVVDVANFE
jgi:hypothetical protein